MLVAAAFLITAGVLFVTLVPTVRCTSCRILEAYDERILTGNKRPSILPYLPRAQRPPCSRSDDRKKMTLVKYWPRN